MIPSATPDIVIGYVDSNRYEQLTIAIEVSRLRSELHVNTETTTLAYLGVYALDQTDLMQITQERTCDGLIDVEAVFIR